MAYLEYGLHQNEGFIVVTGDVGAGKTTIVRSLLDKLDPEQVVAGNLVSTQIDAEDTLRLVASSFGLRTKDIEKSDLLLVARGVPGLGEPAGQARAAHRRRSAEPDAARRRGAAHAVELPARDARAAAELPRRPAGVPAHDAKPADAAAAPARDRRVPHRTARCRRDARLHRAPAEVRRLEGRAASSSPAPTKAIYKASAGIPRRINAVCDRMLLSGYLAGQREFTREDVDMVAREMHDETVDAEVAADAHGAPAADAAEGARLAPRGRATPRACSSTRSPSTRPRACSPRCSPIRSRSA